jgi:hypothetical protein
LHESGGLKGGRFRLDTESVGQSLGQPSREKNVNWPLVSVLALLLFAAGFATVYAWGVFALCGDSDSACGHPSWMKSAQFALANIGFVVAVLMLIWSAVGANRKSLRALAVAVVLYGVWLPLVAHVASTY